jgi:hypothetical protein
MLGGCATHAYLCSIDVQSLSQILAHGVAVIPDLWVLTDDDRVHIRDPPGLADDGADLAQEIHRVGVFIAFVGIREVVSDIFESGSPKQGIGDGMGEDIGVRVTEESSLKGYIYTAKDEPTRLTVFREGVNVEA